MMASPCSSSLARRMVVGVGVGCLLPPQRCASEWRSWSPINRNRNRASSSSSYPFAQLEVVARASLPGKSFQPTKRSRRKKVEDDPWEALFDQLEKDMGDSANDEGNEEGITEEDIVEFERELETVMMGLQDEFPDDDDEELTPSAEENLDTSTSDRLERDLEMNIEEPNNNNTDDSDELPSKRTVELERWQLQKLATALQLGRRKVKVKNLASDLGLDRADVLAFLQSPPPELLMVSAMHEPENDSESDSELGALATKPTGNHMKQEKNLRSAPDESANSKPFGASRSWSESKRIRKVHLKTLELVYQRNKRPTDTMIQNLVQLTNLPRKRIVDWFESKRLDANVHNKF